MGSVLESANVALGIELLGVTLVPLPPDRVTISGVHLVVVVPRMAAITDRPPHRRRIGRLFWTCAAHRARRRLLEILHASQSPLVGVGKHGAQLQRQPAVFLQEWSDELDEAPEALRYVGEGLARGKVVVAID